MIITISGFPGSGKSSVARFLAKKLDYERIYMGEFHRKIAKRKDLTLEEEQKLAENDPSIDHEVDNEIRKAVESGDDFIIESRTAAGLFRKWGIKKRSVHVFLKCELVVGAKRIFEQKRREGAGGRSEKETGSEEEQLEDVKERMKSETSRYRKYYGFDCYDERLYDLVLDTTDLTVVQTVERIIDFLKKGAT